MKDYYCLDLKFKDPVISSFKYHAHLYIKDEEIFIRILGNEEIFNLSRKFSMSQNSLGLFKENFEIIKSETTVLFDQSRINKIETNTKNNFFTIYLTNICVVRENKYEGNINKGEVYLNSNGLKVVNNFYSFFTNSKDKNTFEIGRMKGMRDFYNCNDLKFRPELEFSGHDRRNSKEFTIRRIPIINYSFENESFESVKEKIDIVCMFLSFCYGIRVNYSNLRFRTKDKIYFYFNYETLNNTYNSETSPIFRFLNNNCRIEQILCSSWFENYISNKGKLNKAIENYLHSREVDGSAEFLLLFSIIEIFNTKQKIEKFEFNELKDENFSKALELIENTLSNKDEVNLLRDKWQGTINKLNLKPMKSPLEETLKHNGIVAENYGFSFNTLKKVRDKLTHGSIASIDNEKLKEYIYAIAKISISLILSQLGFKDELKTDL